MIRLTPYALFCVAYIAISAALVWLQASLEFSLAFDCVSPIAALVSVFMALRSGALSKRGIFAVSAGLAHVMYASITFTYHWIAVSVGGSVSALALAQAGGFPFLLNTLVFVISPVVSLAVLERVQGKRIERSFAA